MSTPLILYFDIETTIAIFAGFGLGKQHIGHTQILKRPQVMCISWAWNNRRVQHAAFDLSKYDLSKKDDDADYKLLETFSGEFRKADLVVGQNSIAFDLPTITSRLIRHKLPPLPQILHDDTFLQTKKPVRHISHKLDDVGDYLGYGNKAEHGNGMDWWIRVSQGDKQVLQRMIKYCDDDVNKLRKIYKHQLPYVKSNLNMSAFTGTTICPSPTCGSKDIVKDGFRRTGAGRFQRYSCNTCGNYFTDGKNLISSPGNIVR